MRVWIASLLFYSAIFILCEVLRFIVERFCKPRNAHVGQLLLEAIGTVQVCAPMFDVNFILDNYGLSGCFIEIVFLELVNAFLLRDAVADPCPLIHGLIKGCKTASYVFTVLAVQFSAAYASYLFARFFWSLGMHPSHVETLHDECSSDLTVTIVYGSLVEAGGTLAGKAAELIFEKHLDESYFTLACATVSGLVTVLGIHLTGMYGNPIVAWACTFNCGQVSHLAHFVVYWVAPLLAWQVADRYLHGPSAVKED